MWCHAPEEGCFRLACMRLSSNACSTSVPPGWPRPHPGLQGSGPSPLAAACHGLMTARPSACRVPGGSGPPCTNARRSDSACSPMPAQHAHRTVLPLTTPAFASAKCKSAVALVAPLRAGQTVPATLCLQGTAHRTVAPPVSPDPARILTLAGHALHTGQQPSLRQIGSQQSRQQEAEVMGNPAAEQGAQHQ